MRKPNIFVVVLLTLLVGFISTNALCQNQDTIRNISTTEKIISPSLRVDLGLFHPILKFRRSLRANDINPSLGFYIGNHISNELRLDVGITLEEIINSSDSIKFIAPENYGKTKSNL